MNKQKFYFSSANKEAGMRAVEWLPEGEPKAVLHICCDENKHMQCREELADYFTQQGFIVAACKPSEKKEMHRCLKKAKDKYADIPHLLVGCSDEATVVQSFITEYPEAVEGVVLAGSAKKPVTVDEKLPVLQIDGVEDNCREVFRCIFRWTEERLDEMLYHAATKY